jgi:glycosyltransferase involved in cell wall biosynthesis
MVNKENNLVQIVMPVHNEAESIEEIIMEIYNEISPRLPVEFIICEDGSADGTKEVLLDLSKKIPMKLIMSNERKGYSQAFIDGLKNTTAEYVFSLDSDGQFVPSDFWKLYEKKDDYDVIIGWRVHRADRSFRLLMSNGFRLLHKLLFRVPLHNPGCGFLLIKKDVIDSVVNELGVLKQGLWWEFTARVYRKGFKITEVPIQHRLRYSGNTRVYTITKIPGIAYAHIIGLLKIWKETR